MAVSIGGDDDDFASSVLVSMVVSHLGVGTVIILLGLVPLLLLYIFVICDASEVVTLCMFCIMVGSISVPYMSLHQTTFSPSLKSVLIYTVLS